MKIAILGDSCLDRYRYGYCDRLSPEAPVPILKFSDIQEKVGMAANVEKNLCSLGFDTTLYTNQEKIIKERFIEKRSMQQLLRVDYEILPLNKIDYLENIDFNQYDGLVISDYDKGFITEDSVKNILKIVKNRKPIFVDSKKKNLSCYEGCIIKINELENSLVTNWPNKYEKIVTLGSAGALYKNKLYKSSKVEVFDVCGAGDSFISGLVYGFFKNDGNLEKSIVLANKVASISVKHFGNYAVTEDEIRI